MLQPFYLERGFAAGPGDVEALTALLGHAPRRCQDFARETSLDWQKSRDGAGDVQHTAAP